MEQKKKVNNKGFSLVELIVVVLIMAIIAVSLAPQVMKWVNNARLSTDRQTADSVVSIARLALTDFEAYGAVTGDGGSEYTISVDKSGCTIKKGGATPGSGDAFVEAFCSNVGVTTTTSIDSIALKSSGITVVVTVSSSGVVSSNAETVLSSTDFE